MQSTFSDLNIDFMNIYNHFPQPPALYINPSLEYNICRNVAMFYI